MSPFATDYSEVISEPLTRLFLESFHFNGVAMAWGDRLMQQFGLTSALWHVLGAAAQGPQTQAQIARRMGLTRQSVRRSAGILEQRGLVEFHHNPNHKRARLVMLTEQGQQQLDAIITAYHQATGEIIAQLSPDALEAAADLLQQLSARLDPRPL